MGKKFIDIPKNKRDEILNAIFDAIKKIDGGVVALSMKVWFDEVDYLIKGGKPDVKPWSYTYRLNEGYFNEYNINLKCGYRTNIETNNIDIVFYEYDWINRKRIKRIK